MGQINLPRVNRLNNSMFWESSLFLDSKHFNSVKLYIFFRYFTNNFFKFSLSSYFYSWDLQLYLKKSPVFSNKSKIFNLAKNIDLNPDNDIFSLKTYLYVLHNNFYVFYVYTNFNRIAAVKLDKGVKGVPLDIQKISLYI